MFNAIAIAFARWRFYYILDLDCLTGTYNCTFPLENNFSYLLDKLLKLLFIVKERAQLTQNSSDKNLPIECYLREVKATLPDRQARACAVPGTGASSIPLAVRQYMVRTQHRRQTKVLVIFLEGSWYLLRWGKMRFVDNQLISAPNTHKENMTVTCHILCAQKFPCLLLFSGMR